jgi:hypothetical protein
MGWALLKVYESAPAYVLALSAGFLPVGPFLCMGLYDVSARIERGEAPDFAASLVAWRRKLDALGLFGLVLLVLELLCGRASLVVFALSFDGMPDFKGSILKLLDPRNIEEGMRCAVFDHRALQLARPVLQTGFDPLLVVDRHERYCVASERDRLAVERRVRRLEALRIGRCLHEARFVEHAEESLALETGHSHGLLF